MVEATEIERRVDRAITAAIPVSTNLGGIDPENYGQVMEFAKTMATCRAGIPNWLRTSVGDCLMICTRAMRWRMDPFFVAEKSYLMENKRTGESKVGYESQLIHAVIESLAPLKGRLRHEFRGEGDDTVCVVSGTFKGEDKPHEYISEPLSKRIKDIGKSDSGNFRGSPLWLTKPRVQLFYDASRDWARINCPDVLAGVYTRDELPDHEPVDVTPKGPSFSEKLEAAKKARVGGRGFDAAKINTIIEGDINPEVVTKEAEDEGTKGSGSEPDREGRSSDAEGRADGDIGAAGRGGVGDSNPADVASPVGVAAPAEGKADDQASRSSGAKPKARRSR